MKVLKEELLGAKLGEVRFMYQTGTAEEDTILEALNTAIDKIREAGVKIDSYSDEDRRRFNSME